jgi:calcineurin-like phosphoesterase family protein
MPNIFFSADLHFFSKNIIKYCNRPFSSVEEMDEALISNYNSKVTNKDTIYLLGDLIWGHLNYAKYLSRLNGQKHLILGNHDNKQCYKKMQIDGLIQSMSQQKGITIDNKYIWMCHYPMRSWNRSFHGSYHLYGHCHNTIEDYGLSTDVGVDKWNYSPVSFD